MIQFLSRFVRTRRGNFAAQASALTLGSLMMLPGTSRAYAAPVEVGVWVDHDGKGAIEIKQCGAGLCGNIVWLRKQVNDQGEPLFDRRNPDATKRNRPICGLPVIGNLKLTSDGWDDGWIYSPEEGSQYDLAIQATGRDKLTVTGYKGVKLFSKTFVWTRAPNTLQKCGTQPSQTKAVPPGGAPLKAVAPKPETAGNAPAAAKKPVAPGAAPQPLTTEQSAAKATAASQKKAAVSPDGKASAKPATKPPAKTASPAAKDAKPAAAPAKTATKTGTAKAKPETVAKTPAAGTKPPAKAATAANKNPKPPVKAVAAGDATANVKAAAKKPTPAKAAAAAASDKKTAPKKKTTDESEDSPAVD